MSARYFYSIFTLNFRGSSWATCVQVPSQRLDLASNCSLIFRAHFICPPLSRWCNYDRRITFFPHISSIFLIPKFHVTSSLPDPSTPIASSIPLCLGNPPQPSTPPQPREPPPGRLPLSVSQPWRPCHWKRNPEVHLPLHKGVENPLPRWGNIFGQETKKPAHLSFSWILR